jgi:hypothetical protein
MFVDTDTNRVLSPLEVQEAQDNPYIYKWVREVPDEEA